MRWSHLPCRKTLTACGTRKSLCPAGRLATSVIDGASYPSLRSFSHCRNDSTGLTTARRGEGGWDGKDMAWAVSYHLPSAFGEGARG